MYWKMNKNGVLSIITFYCIFQNVKSSVYVKFLTDYIKIINRPVMIRDYSCSLKGDNSFYFCVIENFLLRLA